MARAHGQPPCLGLETAAGYSPAIQEMSVPLASKMQVAEASFVLERLTGVKLPPPLWTVKPAVRANAVQTLRRPGRQALNSNCPLEPHQMIIASGRQPGAGADR